MKFRLQIDNGDWLNLRYSNNTVHNWVLAACKLSDAYSRRRWSFDRTFWTRHYRSKGSELMAKGKEPSSYHYYGIAGSLEKNMIKNQYNLYIYTFMLACTKENIKL